MNSIELGPETAFCHGLWQLFGPVSALARLEFTCRQIAYRDEVKADESSWNGWLF